MRYEWEFTVEYSTSVLAILCIVCKLSMCDLYVNCNVHSFNDRGGLNLTTSIHKFIVELSWSRYSQNLVPIWTDVSIYCSPDGHRSTRFSDVLLTNSTRLNCLTVSRLTQFNASRGGEPARLSRTEWEEGESGIWFNDCRMQSEDELEKRLFKEMKVTFQSGKGNNHL